MFLASTSRLYARETTEEEFIRYVRDNGVSAALQPALILLYRLPIKPNNLKEFFAEYLENGGCTITNLSLLRAELCYLQSEEQNLQARLRKLDRDLEEMSDVIKNLNIKESEAVIHEKPTEEGQNTDLMSRFVEDTKKNPSNNYNPFDLSTPDFQAEEVTAAEAEEKGEEEEEGEAEEAYIAGVTKNFECIENQDSLMDMIDDLKEFDPWGMIFKYYDNDLKYELAKPKTNGNQNNADKSVLPADIKQELNKDTSQEKGSALGGSNDSEDADTLVELFHAKILPDEPINETFLLKQKTEKLKFSDLMGWGNYQNTEYKSIPKYPLSMTRQTKSNVFGNQDIKGQVLNSNKWPQNIINIKNLVKFYSQVNADDADGDLFMGKYTEDSYSKGIQTDLLQEFEELDGEDWEWEWDSDDYLLSERNSTAKVKSTAASEKDGNGNILSNDSKKGYPIANETYANVAEISNSIISQQKQLDSLSIQQLNDSTQSVLSPDTLSVSQPCSNPSKNIILKPPKEVSQKDQQSIRANKLLDTSDKKTGKFAYTKPYSKEIRPYSKAIRIRPYSKSPKPNANSQGSRKTAKILKYIKEVYDADTATKLQQQFDFRIFDD